MNTIYTQPKQAINEATIIGRLIWLDVPVWGKTPEMRWAAMHDYCKKQSPNSYRDNYEIYNKVIMEYSGLEREVSGLVYSAMAAFKEQVIGTLRMVNQGLPSPVQNGEWVY